MGVAQDLNHETWSWYRVVMADSISSIDQADILLRSRKYWTHPRYEEARKWCEGQFIKAAFVPRISGGFRFQDARDAMAFKLVWG